MKQRFKILMLEDNHSDAELITRLLEKDFINCHVKIAMTEESFRSALPEFSPDIILADNSLPQFSAAEALKIIQREMPYIPFIMVTGTVSEEFAAGIIKQGADDYILKDRLIRLPKAIHTALKQKALEKANREAQRKLVESEERYRSLFHNSPLPVFVFDIHSLIILEVNETACRHYGYKMIEFLKMTVDSIVIKEDVQQFIQAGNNEESGYNQINIWRHIKKNGGLMTVKIFFHDLPYKNSTARMVIVEDITELIKAEEELRDMEAKIAAQRIEEQKKISRAIIQAQEKERNHIGQELHDNVNQILAGTKMYLSMAVKGQPSLHDLIQYPMSLIDSSIKEIRLLTSRHVTPTKDVNLQELVRTLEGTLRTAEIKAYFTIELKEDNISDDLKLNIYRLIQEQVNNIIKHAAATHATVILKSWENNIELSIADDGKGFNTTGKRKGIGISNMMNRIQTFNGTIDIQSSAGNGCTVNISIPYQQEVAEGMDI